MNTPIIGVVPQFGATFPYSMFKGLRISPKRVFNAIIVNKRVNLVKKKRIELFMNLDTAFVAFGIASFAIGLTLLTIYSSFGPGSENLIDPFEEDDD